MRLAGSLQVNRRAVGHGWKTLYFREAHTAALSRDTIHTWPRGDVLLHALPHRSGGLVATLILPLTGTNGFEALRTEQHVEALFRRLFPGVAAFCPGTARQAVLFLIRWRQQDRARTTC